MTKVIVFDFDGVIVDSERIKQEAFEKTFTDWGEEAPRDAIRAAREEFAEGKGDRYAIIRGIFERLGKQKIDERVQQYAKRYGEVVTKYIISIGVLKETREVLEELSRRYPLYVNSINPDDALREIVEKLQLTALFKGLYGSSRSKDENLKEIAKKENISPNEMVFIGDGEGDRRAAKDFGCLFVGIGNDMNKWRAENDGRAYPVIQCLSELPRQLTIM